MAINASQFSTHILSIKFGLQWLLPFNNFELIAYPVIDMKNLKKGEASYSQNTKMWTTFTLSYKNLKVSMFEKSGGWLIAIKGYLNNKK